MPAEPIIYSVDVPDAYEEHGSISEMYNTEGKATESVTLRCKWIDRYKLVSDLLTKTRFWPQINIGTAVHQCTIKPVPSKYEKAGQGIIYDEALVTVAYDFKTEGNKETTKDEAGNDVIFSETLEPSTEYVEDLDYRKYRWDSNEGEQIKPEECPRRRYLAMQLKRKMYSLKAIPVSVLSLIGKVNDEEYTSTSLGLTFPKETLLFKPPTLERSFTAEGTKGWDLSVGFQFREQTWNKYFRPEDEGFTAGYTDMYKMKSKNPGNKPYKQYPLGSFKDWLF